MAIAIVPTATHVSEPEGSGALGHSVELELAALLYFQTSYAMVKVSHDDASVCGGREE